MDCFGRRQLSQLNTGHSDAPVFFKSGFGGLGKTLLMPAHGQTLYLSIQNSPCLHV